MQAALCSCPFRGNGLAEAGAKVATGLQPPAAGCAGVCLQHVRARHFFLHGAQRGDTPHCLVWRPRWFVLG